MNGSEIAAEARMRAERMCPAPRYDPWIAAMTAGFVSGIISIVPLTIAGSGDPTRGIATSWTTIIIGGVVWAWFAHQKRLHDREFQREYEELRLAAGNLATR